MLRKYLPILILLIAACNAQKDLPSLDYKNNWKAQKLPVSKQSEAGDPEKGYDYLVNGNYIGSGIPFDFMKKRLSDNPPNILNREGESAKIAPMFNVAEASNGVQILAGSCLTCHAGYLDGQYIVGLGNTLFDYSKNLSPQFKMARFLIHKKYKKDSPEREAFQIYGDINKEAFPYIICPNPGVNPAFKLEEGYMKSRDPKTLEMQEAPLFEQSKYTLASDCPPWWHVKKKNALYYNGMGRGDFTKLLMQASTQGVADTIEARKIQEQFKHILAYLNTIEAPSFPKEVNQSLAQKGQVVFEEKCSNCHGTYGQEETYPNKLVALEAVKTDPYYARYFTDKSNLVKWYNESWYATSEPASQLKPSDGYVAPPLDGVWASAPYLHNGSVPTVEALLNSKIRPTYWQRTWENTDYNYDQLGWNYSIPENKKGKYTYDTTLPGYGNQGHYFGDDLSDEDRKSVIEYLKTL